MHHPRFADVNDAANSDLLAPLREIAAARGVTVAQVALGWLHGRERVFGLPVVPIPGTHSRSRVENAGGAVRPIGDGEPPWAAAAGAIATRTKAGPVTCRHAGEQAAYEHR